MSNVVIGMCIVYQIVRIVMTVSAKQIKSVLFFFFCLRSAVVSNNDGLIFIGTNNSNNLNPSILIVVCINKSLFADEIDSIIIDSPVPPILTFNVVSKPSLTKKN